MCLSTPKMPKMPEMPPAPPPAPTPLPPEEPTPAPQLVSKDAASPKLTQRRSKRAQIQQASQGTGALRIPLNAPPAGGLNIPR